MNKKQSKLKMANKVLRPLSDRELAKEVKKWLGGKKSIKQIENCVALFSHMSASMFGLLLLLDRKKILSGK